VIATGTELGRTWTFRGRIGDDGVWTSVVARGAGGGGGGGGGGGALPFQDLGWQRMGHFGTVGSGGSGPPALNHVDGVVSKQTAAVDVHLVNGAVLPAQLIDTGDPRASFFIAVWTADEWEKLVARDARGVVLETLAASSL